MKILLSAYHCEAGRGSEYGIGWGWAEQAARFHEVWVLTLADHRPAIERSLLECPLPNAHFVYLGLPKCTKHFRNGGVGATVCYYAWQIAAYFVARRLHRRNAFDIVHHVTYVCYWRPTFLALLPSPFVWGPVGGGESAPRSFRKSFGLRGRIFEIARDLARMIGERDPFVRHAARKASLGLATTEETARRMRTLGCKPVLVLTQVGLSREDIGYLSTYGFRHSGMFRLISVGRLIHWKGHHLGLRAFAIFQRRVEASEYWIVGDGPERRSLEQLAEELGVADKVKFWGWMPRREALQMLAECDVLVLPSLHESGGYVCSESMAAGRPVICLDLGGPALQVTEDTGIKITVSSPEQAVLDMADAFHELASDPQLLARLGVAAKKRVAEHFDWNVKGLIMAEYYGSVAAAKRGIADSCGPL